MRLGLFGKNVDGWSRQPTKRQEGDNKNDENKNRFGLYIERDSKYKC